LISRPMISMTYDQRRETFRFAYAKHSFRFRCFRASPTPKRNGRLPSSQRLRRRKAALAVVAAAAGRNYRKSCAKEVLTH
jgi:hypothetical protein